MNDDVQAEQNNSTSANKTMHHATLSLSHVLSPLAATRSCSVQAPAHEQVVDPRTQDALRHFEGVAVGGLDQERDPTHFRAVLRAHLARGTGWARPEREARQHDNEAETRIHVPTHVW